MSEKEATFSPTRIGSTVGTGQVDGEEKDKTPMEEQPEKALEKVDNGQEKAPEAKGTVAKPGQLIKRSRTVDYVEMVMPPPSPRPSSPTPSEIDRKNQEDDVKAIRFLLAEFKEAKNIRLRWKYDSEFERLEEAWKLEEKKKEHERDAEEINRLLQELRYIERAMEEYKARIEREARELKRQNKSKKKCTIS